jgi:hypothetical protein
MTLGLVTRRAPLALLLASLLLAGGAARARAQDTTSTANIQVTSPGMLVVLTLVDGSVLQGRVLEVTPTTLRFASAIGETTIPRSAIQMVRVVDAGQVHGGQVWPEDPSRTRLFFAPTGRMMRKGEQYFADAYIFFPSFQAGISDRFTMGAGMSIIPGLGIDEQLFYLTPKLGIVAGPDVNVAVGALIAAASGVDESPFGIAYGVATFGGEETNATIGGGFGYNRGTADNSALLMVGGSTRVSRGISLVSENYLYTGAGTQSVLSGGVRFIGDRLTVDLAAWVWAREAAFPVPYVAFLYRL